MDAMPSLIRGRTGLPPLPPVQKLRLVPMKTNVSTLQRWSPSKHVSQHSTISQGMSYRSAGVDIDAGNELVRRIQALNPNIGGFSGMVPFGDSYLVAGTDGVGTKLKLAFDMNKHDTVGIDLVAMSVNDIITSGAKPLFFLDYFATGKLEVDTAEQVSITLHSRCGRSKPTLFLFKFIWSYRLLESHAWY
jgi:hypothetical protein